MAFLQPQYIWSFLLFLFWRNDKLYIPFYLRFLFDSYIFSGKTAKNIRNRGDYAEHKQKLLDIGFDFTRDSSKLRAVIRNNQFERIYEALEVFKREEGHLNVPRSFTVPSEDEKWPTKSWGLHLGE